MSVGLLITTFDRNELLRNSLDRLARLSLPDQLCLVDDGGSDSGMAIDVLNRFQVATGVSTKYIYNDNPEHSICSFARNMGLKWMDTDIIVTSEPEVIFLTDVIHQLAKEMERLGGQVISAGTVYHQGRLASLGDIVADGDVSKLGKAVDHDPHRLEPWEDGFLRTRGWVAPYTAGYRRDWLIDVGGWDETFPGNWGWDDIDLLTRLRINMHPQVIHQGIQVLHQWHPPGPGQADNGKENEEHFYSKSFHINGESDTADVIANRGHEWGTGRPPTMSA